MIMDWRKLHFGKITHKEIAEAVVDEDWQRVRQSLKFSTLEYKYAYLTDWLLENNCSRKAQIQVTNYINALSRGGLIRPEDYKCVSRTKIT